ncbi:MAG TPA: alkaline phosphatase family protein [Vicinamibacterales bacterium]
MALTNVEHIVVLMLENRSLDNLLGYLYSPTNLPQVTPGNPPYDGLAFGGPYSNKDLSGNPVTANMPTSNWPPARNPHEVPYPDPGEPFDDVTEQVAKGDMSGFVKNYQSQKGVTGTNAAQIMQSYSSQQLTVLSALASSFAVSDAWFCSMPTQTWPNRAFVHAGSSQGNAVNSPYLPYTIDTVYNVLDSLNVSWDIFHDTEYTPALTQLQFVRLWDSQNVFRLAEFQTRCNRPVDAPDDEKLPKYSFIEPRFIAERPILDPFKIEHSEDYHPPNNVIHGEALVAKVYDAIRTCPYRDRILFVITFDEHGGTYDHVTPPSNAQPPNPDPVAKNGFKYDRFGVRVPAIVISDYVQGGTVFRSTTGTPFDHTSILATLRDWLGIGGNAFFTQNPRISAAPTLDGLLQANAVNTNWPVVAPNWGAQTKTSFLAAAQEEVQQILELPADDLEHSIVQLVDQYMRYKRSAGAQKPATIESHLAELLAPLEKKLVVHPRRRDEMERLRSIVIGNA